jgi:hypothetical protein
MELYKHVCDAKISSGIIKKESGLNMAKGIGSKSPEMNKLVQGLGHANASLSQHVHSQCAKVLQPGTLCP